MGGNALRHLNPVRLSSKEVVDIYNHLQRLYTTQNNLNLKLVPWIEEKDDHGDIDIIVHEHADTLIPWIENVLGVSKDKYKVNNNIISTAFPIYNDLVAQVDFICYDKSLGASNWVSYFFSGGDFGLYMGRLAAAYGYVFAMNGLKLRHDPSKAWSEDIVLTQDPKTAAEFLGYGWPLPRFRTYEDLWRYIMSSRLARPWMFMPQGTNNDNRCRDKQRPMVVKFQEWLEKHGVVRDNQPFKVIFSAALDVAHHYKRFGVVYDRVNEQREAYETKRLQNRKFGEGAARSVLVDSLSKEQIGEILRDMQKLLPDKNTRSWILERGGPDSQDLLLLAIKNAARFIALSKGHKVKP